MWPQCVFPFSNPPPRVWPQSHLHHYHLLKFPRFCQEGMSSPLANPAPRSGLCVKWVTQSSPTLCNPMDYIVHGILQAQILEWVAFLFSRGSSHPGIKPRCPAWQADSLPAGPQGSLSLWGLLSSLAFLLRAPPSLCLHHSLRSPRMTNICWNNEFFRKQCGQFP